MKSPLKTIVRIATALIPAKKLRKRIRRRLSDRIERDWIDAEAPKIHAKYAALKEHCRAKIARNEKLRVCFLVCDAAMFSAESVYLKMRADSRYETFIAVAPRITRGEKFLRETLHKTVTVLTERYGEVMCLYDPDTKKRESLYGKADIVFTTVVYANQTFSEYTTRSLSDFALTACISYGYSGQLLADTRKMIFTQEFAFFWKLFVPNAATLALWGEKNPHLKRNLALGGYSKMDRLSSIPRKTAGRKKILICPHHSLGRDEGGGVQLSNFIKYSGFFLELPGRYPDIDFVFRPHPLLFPRLATDAWWGDKKTAEYRAAMEAMPNVEFQSGGDYFETFAKSDAMIHDCGSFFAEYFYTGNPQCYLLEDKGEIDREFTDFGKALHDHVFHAFSENDIVDFIDTVVVAEADDGRAARESFARDEVCIFHPDASGRVIQQLEEWLS